MSQFPGADWGAKLNAADADLGAAHGEIWSDVNAGTTITTAWTLSSYHTLRFIQGVTLTYSASGTLNQDSCIVGAPNSFNDDQGSEPKPSVDFEQANGVNLAQALTIAGAHACVEEVYFGGNRANNTTTIGLLVNSSRAFLWHASFSDFPSDGIKLNSTGTSNQAANFRVSQSSASRNLGDGINIVNTLDVRLDQFYSEFNSRYGIESLNSTLMLSNMSEISVNSIGGIYIHVNNNSFPFSGLFSMIMNSSFGNNGATCTTATGGDVVIDGHDPTLNTNNLAYLTVVAGNRMVGGNNPTGSNCDSIHIQDGQLNNIYGNLIISSSSNQFRRAVGIFSVSGTEGRDNVSGNTCQGTFSAAGGLCIAGTSATQFSLNNDNGAANFEELDLAPVFVPNNHCLNVKNAAGTVQCIYTPLTNANIGLFGQSETDFTPLGNTTPLLKLTDTTPAQANPTKWLSSAAGEFRIINSALSVNLLRLTDAGQLILGIATGTAPLAITSTTPVANLSLGGGAGTSVKAATYASDTNCAVNSVSPAACGSAASGAFVIPTTTTSYTVNTTAVTAASRIFLFPMSFAGNLPSAPTCVVPAITAEPTVSAISAGVSFTMTEASTTGQTCWQYHIVN